MTKEELREEKMEDIKNDVRYEEKLRKDYDFCFNEAIEQFDLEDAIKNIDLAIKWMETSGWEMDRCTLVREI